MNLLLEVFVVPLFVAEAAWLFAVVALALVG
jgi:hypothetical protein